MKKFNVPIKDIYEDFTITDNIWLTTNDKKNSFNFFKKENKKELVLIANNESRDYDFLKQKMSQDLKDWFHSVIGLNNCISAYYINSSDNSIQTVNKSDIFPVLFKRKDKKFIFIDKNILELPIDNGDALVGFNNNITNNHIEKLSQLIYNSKEISYPFLKVIQSALSHLGEKSKPIFLIDVSSHQSYSFPIKSTLKTVSLTIDMIRDKVLKHYSEKIWQIETVLA